MDVKALVVLISLRIAGGYSESGVSRSQYRSGLEHWSDAAYVAKVSTPGAIVKMANAGHQYDCKTRANSMHCRGLRQDRPKVQDARHGFVLRISPFT
jgi:hypothetical protein